MVVGKFPLAVIISLTVEALQDIIGGFSHWVVVGHGPLLHTESLVPLLEDHLGAYTSHRSVSRPRSKLGTALLRLWIVIDVVEASQVRVSRDHTIAILRIPRPRIEYLAWRRPRQAISLDASPARSLVALIKIVIISLGNRHRPVKLNFFLYSLMRSYCCLEGCWLFSGKNYTCHQGSSEGHELFHFKYYN